MEDKNKNVSGGLAAFRRARRTLSESGLRIAVSVATAICTASAIAQTSVPSSVPGEEGVRRQEERLREQQQRQDTATDVLRPAAPRIASGKLPAEAPCFVVRELVLTGAGWQRFAWLLDEAQPFLNQCAGVQGLRQIASAMDAALTERGYATTRVALPTQNLASGTLTLLVQVGRVERVRMVRAGDRHGGDDTAWGTWRNAMPVRAGDVLDIRDIEQGVEQMNRLPSQPITTRIEPGAAPDTSVLVIERPAARFSDRLRGGLTVDNSGSQTLGRAQISANLAVDNPVGINDILNLGFNGNAEHPTTDHRSQSLSAGYSVPWGYDSFSLSVSHNRFAQRVQGTTVVFLSSGSSDNADLKWQRIVLRDAASKTGVYFDLAARRARSYLDDVELLVQRRHTSSLEAGLTHRHLFARSNLDIDLAYREGLPWFGAEDDLSSAADGGLTLRPKLWSLSLGWDTRFALFGRPLQYSVALRGQHTEQATLSADQFSIGSRYSVRGFDGDSVLLAESGYSLRNELGMPFRVFASLDALVFLAVDHGRVWGPSSALLIGNSLTGAALGVRGRWRAFSVDLSLGSPLRKPDGFHSQRYTVYAALTTGF